MVVPRGVYFWVSLVLPLFAILAVVLTTLAIPLILRIATRAPGPGPWPPAPRAGVEVVDVPSTVLGRTMPALVWTPSGTAPDAALPLVVLFHGQGGDASAWFHAIGADLIAERLIDEGRIPPVMLVSAGIGNSMGIDSEPGDRKDSRKTCEVDAGLLCLRTRQVWTVCGGAKTRRRNSNRATRRKRFRQNLIENFLSDV